MRGRSPRAKSGKESPRRFFGGDVIEKSDFISKNNDSSEWADRFFGSNFHSETNHNSQMIFQNAQGHFLDMLQSGELNPNTALLYFKWADANLDDIEKLFADYGN